MNVAQREARRSGLTLVEVTIVVLLVGIVAGIAVPAHRELGVRARAAAAMGDVEALRAAAFRYHAETGGWPSDVGPGVLPSELAPYLGPDFDFDREGYRLDWDNWPLPAAAGQPEPRALLGVSVTLDDPALGRALLEQVDEDVPRLELAGRYTFIIASR